MALRLAEVEPAEYVLVCTPTGDELPDWFAHLRRVPELTGAKLQVVTSGIGLNELVKREKMIPNHRARFCTRVLKIEPYRLWLQMMARQHDRVISHVGLRADEEGRAGGAFADIEGVEMRFPLREWGWGIDEVRGYLERRNVQIPKRTDCARCFHQRLGEWWMLWREHPKIYAEIEVQEAELGHTWRSASRDTWPAALKDMRVRFERGEVPRGTVRQMDMLRDVGCCRVCSL